MQYERIWTQASVSADGRIQRRDFLKTLGIGAGVASLGFSDQMLLAAPELRKRGKSMIVLWMAGAPTQFETFDPKPGTSDGAQTKVIETAAPGIQIADFWPKVARQMKDITLIRSMTSKEGNHDRATYQMHTGYVPSGSVRHPSIGALIASEIAPQDFDLPAYVSVMGNAGGGGFLPVRYAPFRIGVPTRPPENVVPPVSEKQFNKRLELMKRLEQSYAQAGAKQQVEDHQILYNQAANMVMSPRLKAFDVSQENDATRSAYGKSPFGQGCLLARRLVEAGVTFVEVQLGGWDTHQSNAEKVKGLAGQCDPAFAFLVEDLKKRGLLDSTVVLWMGEFGRTPKVNPNAGRDHYPKSFCAAVAGGGLAGGRTVGKTNANGSEVVERPVNVTDLFATLCKTMGIDPKKENLTPQGRPVKLVNGGEIVKEMLA